MKLRLTDLAVKKLPLSKAGQVTYWDESTPNFGIRCSTRSKSFVALVGERRTRKTLGRYPSLSLADARKQAKRFLAMEAPEASTEIDHDYHVLVEEYLRECRSRLRDSTLQGYVLFLSKVKLSGPISRINRGRVLRAIERYTTSPASQNYAFTTLKVFFNWAVRRQYLASNPLEALKKPNKAKSRERVLDEKEVRTLLRYTMANRDRFHDIVTLLLMTGQRRGEIAELQWSEIDEDHLVLSEDRTKNKRSHTVPLGKQAKSLFHSIVGGERYVFGTPLQDVPFSGWSRAQRRLIKETGFDHFTLHDLRRTFATNHARIGTPIHVTEKLLNHVSGTISGVAAVYNRHNYMDEMRSATDAYDEYLANLLQA
ncbi:site-specific integrase [uncultured Litoreibacter sp.]|uniref:tyrosine-type recombinase/integrase n=1 Tax=uncultured Litoreibacter sp. TaxID=1392394 RepID=UPI002623E632|nr:site-specific integrase [uncultured Litoreibacter sp.]